MKLNNYFGIKILLIKEYKSMSINYNIKQINIKK